MGEGRIVEAIPRFMTRLAESEAKRKGEEGTSQEGRKFLSFPPHIFLSWRLASPLVLTVPKVPVHLNSSYVAVREEDAGQEQGLQK